MPTEAKQTFLTTEAVTEYLLLHTWMQCLCTQKMLYYRIQPWHNYCRV